MLSRTGKRLDSITLVCFTCLACFRGCFVDTSESVTYGSHCPVVQSAAGRFLQRKHGALEKGIGDCFSIRDTSVTASRMTCSASTVHPTQQL